MPWFMCGGYVVYSAGFLDLCCAVLYCAFCALSGRCWRQIAEAFPNHSDIECMIRWKNNLSGLDGKVRIDRPTCR